MAQVIPPRKPLTQGVVAATLTPISEQGAVDCDLLADHCRRLLESDCSNIVLMGTTGEANSFTVAERKAVLEQVLKRGLGADRLIVGTGCSAIGDTAELSRHALSLGVTRVLVLPPFYYKKVTDEGLFDAYARTIEQINDDRLRIYLYLIPQITGIEISVGLIEKLASAFPRHIAGLKDSSGNWSEMETICHRLGGKLDVLVGSELFLTRALRAGASGCVTATANVAAKPIVELFKQGEAVSTSLEKNIIETRGAFEAFPVIPALKAYLAHVTGNAQWRNVRPPLCPLTAEATHKLLSQLNPEALNG